MKTTVRADAKLQNLPPDAHDELWALRHPEEEGGKVWTLTDVAAWVPDRFRFTVSVAAVGNFYQWLDLKRRMDGRAALADQLKVALAADPSFTQDQIKKAGQKLFLAEGLVDRNPKVFAAMVELDQNDTRLAQNDAAIRLKKEAGKREERKLAILEGKANRLDALEAKAREIRAGGGLSEETLDMLEKQLKLL